MIIGGGYNTTEGNRRMDQGYTKLSIEKTDTSGAAHFMCTGHKKVHIQILDIHWHIGNGLACVDLWTWL